MGKAEIIADLGAGHYTIKRVYAGRDAAQAKVAALNTRIAGLQSQYSSMPESTEDEIFQKAIVKLQIASLQTQVKYIQNNFPKDIEADVYCADYTEELSGEVGTIDIPGEVTELVNIRPGYDATAAFDAERDGEFWPSIAVGPWTCFLNKCILPGWQKWYPKYRYGWIVPESINYEDNTCAVTIQSAFSSQQDLDVNQGDGFGGEIVEEEIELEYFKQDVSMAHPGFIGFCERNPEHPFCQVEELAPPIELSDEKYQEMWRMNHWIDYNYGLMNDQSGYDVRDYWNTMYDWDDEWEMFHIKTLGLGEWDILAPVPTRDGDCEDFVLTKIQAFIQAGIVPAENLQVLLCYLDGRYHAVLGLQTTNRGFLIMDQRDYAGIYEKSYFDRQYRWERFSVAGTRWATVQRLKGDVPIEYMSCNAEAFLGGEYVVVEFSGQDWSKPKVIGFASNPSYCSTCYFFPYTGEYLVEKESNKWMLRYGELVDSWSVHGAFPGDLTAHSACTGNGGIGFRLGGYTVTIDWAVFLKADSDHHWMYDSITELWESAANSQLAAHDQQYKHIGRGVSVVNGGCRGLSLPLTILSTTKGYSLHSDSWSGLQPGMGRYCHASFVLDGKMFVAGGFDGAFQEPSQFFGLLWRSTRTDNVSAYDNLSDTWDLKKKLPNEFGRVKGFSMNGQGYIGGGVDMTRHKTQGELPFSVELRDESCSRNILAYYLCPDIVIHYKFDPNFNWWISKAGMLILRGRGYCWDDQQFNVQLWWSDPVERMINRGFPDEDPPVPPTYTMDSHVLYDYGGSINTGVGLYYDPLSDTWRRGQCHPSYSWAGGNWADSGLGNKMKGMKLGGGQWGSLDYSIIDGLTDTWWEGPGEIPELEKNIGGKCRGSEL